MAFEEISSVVTGELCSACVQIGRGYSSGDCRRLTYGGHSRVFMRRGHSSADTAGVTAP